MRITDAVLSVPRLLLLMAAAAVCNRRVGVLVLLVGGVGWMETARVTAPRSSRSRDREFVLAARALRRLAGRLVLAPPAAERRRGRSSSR